MKKRVIGFLLACLLLIGILPLSQTHAASLNAAPYLNISYGESAGVTAGTIRYVSQLTSSPRFYTAYWDPYVASYLQVDNNHMSHNYLTDPRCWTACPAAIAFSICRRRKDQLVIRRLAFDPPMHHTYLVVQRHQLKSRAGLIRQLQKTILAFAEEAPLLQPVVSGEAAQ